MRDYGESWGNVRRVASETRFQFVYRGFHYPSCPLTFPANMSSPAPYNFPPSSAPGGTPHSSSLAQSRVIDPLAFDNVRGLNGTRAESADVEDTATGAAPRRGGGRRGGLEDVNDIPRVKDATGEKVLESFALFLEK